MLAKVALRWRLTLAFAVGMAVVLVSLGAFVHLRLRSDLTESIDEGLLSQAQFVATAADRGASLSAGGAIVDADDALAQVLDASGAVITSASPLAERPFVSKAQLIGAGGETFLETRVDGLEHALRVLIVRSSTPGVSIVVARSLDDRNEALSRVGLLLLIGGSLALAFSTALGWVLSGAALRPVEQMRREAAAMSMSEPDRRLTVPPADDELRRLSETLNSLLERLQSSMQTERAFLDRASHELRTPLSVLKGELDLALSRPRSSQELESAIRRSSDEVAVLVALAEDLLASSRRDDGRLPVRVERFSLGELLQRLADGFAEQARTAGVAVSVRGGSGISMVADPVRVRQAVSNLVVNSLRHTSPGGTIGIGSASTEDAVSIAVHDSGPGFGPEPVAGSDQHPLGGKGWGLIVVETIARAHGGRIEIDREATGGLVTITFPKDAAKGPAKDLASDPKGDPKTDGARTDAGSGVSS